MFAFSLSLSAAPGVHAQSGQLVDLERLLFTIGEHGLMALPGELQAVGSWVGRVPVTSEAREIGDELPDDPAGFFRLRFMPSFTLVGTQWPVFQAYQLKADIDVTTDVFDDTLDTPLTYDPVHRERSLVPVPRLMETYLLAAGDSLAIKAGLMRSAWGTGILANSGHDQGPGVETSPFGVSRSADRVVRLQVAWFPIERPKREGAGPPLTLAVAVDGVLDDDTAKWTDGDRAYNFVAAVTGEVDSFRGGLYAVHRTQQHGGGGSTEVTVVDAQASYDVLKRGSISAWVAAEVAGIVGTTTRARSAILQKPYDIYAAGGVLRVGLDHTLVQAVLEGGLASGDDNPFDSELRAFTFDREYRVGLLMFRDYQRKVTAVTAYNLADPTYRAEPSRGFERTATEGAVQGALYINPRVAVFPVEGLTLQVGYLHGISQGSYTDPYQSGLAGGVSVGPNGAVGQDELGHEVDVGVDYRLDLDHLSLRFRLEGAWFRPGLVFADPATGRQDDVWGGWLHGGLLW